MTGVHADDSHTIGAARKLIVGQVHELVVEGAQSRLRAVLMTAALKLSACARSTPTPQQCFATTGPIPPFTMT